MSASVRVRVAVARGTRVFVEVVELGEEEGLALSPRTITTTGEALPSEPPPAHPALRLVRPEAA